MGTSCTPANAAVHPETWSRTAALVTGLNINMAACQPTIGTPCYGETSPSDAQWKTILAAMPARNNGFKPIARSNFRVPNPDGTFSGVHADTTIEQVIDGLFADAATFGYSFGNIMFYGNAHNGVSYTWTQAEVQEMRNYLDSNGHSNIGLLWDARSNSAGDRAWCSNSLVTGVLLEAGPNLWFTNAGGRQSLLPWLWTDPSVANKKLIFQIPPVDDPYGVTSGVTDYMAIRRLIQWLGTSLMDFNFMRSSRVVFMPVTYNGPTMTFYPETASASSYLNSMTSVTLSLIEQRDLFEGRRAAMPTVADADSSYRNTPPTIGVIANQSVAPGTLAATIPFTVSDEQTPSAFLSVSGTTSDSQTLVFGGGGATRTVQVPVLQTGTATVSLTVSDGVLSTTRSFSITANPSGLHSAVASGPIQSSTTWGIAPPVAGDTGLWRTGSFSLSMTGSTIQAFNGQCLVVEPGGALAPGIPNGDLTLNDLTLNGGLISINNTNGVNLNVNGFLTLISGTLKAGGANNNRDVRFTSGSLAGSGTIAILAVDSAGSSVDFQSGVNTTGFTGIFDVSGYGVLGLPPISTGSASFGVALSGSGKYANDSNVALTSLSFGGTSVASGTYSYSSFSTAQKAFLVSTTGTLTVVAPRTAPTCSDPGSQVTNESAPITIPFTVGSSQVSSSSLVLAGYTSNSALVRTEDLAFSGTGSSRTVTVSPELYANGTVTIYLSVSDGWSSTTRPFTLTINPVNQAPTISAVPAQHMHSASSLAIPVTVADVESPSNALTLTGTSSNSSLISAIQFSGIGANRVATLTTAPAQTGSANVGLIVSDGLLSSTSSFAVTVTAYQAIQAVASGQINDPLTWGTAIPVLGDTANWQTGSRALTMGTSSETFYGETFEVQAGGGFAPGLPGANLILNNLKLSGGTISMGNNIGLTIDLSGQQFTLLSGTLKTGGASGMGINFKNGSLAGSGTIHIIASGTSGSDVEFVSPISTVGFSGLFSVHNNGVLKLPDIVPDSASFGVMVSGTGFFLINADVSLKSLVLGTDTIAPGTYTYDDFTPYEQQFLTVSDNGGSITVADTAPTISSISNRTIAANSNTGAVAFTVGDSQTSASSLTLSGNSSNTTLVPLSGIAFGGSGANRTVTVTPAGNQAGSATITLTVSDGILTASSSFVLTVNAAPTISSIANLSVSQGTATAAIPFTVGDAETPAAQLTLSGSSSNPSLVPNANIAFSGSGANRTVTVTPAAYLLGNATIIVTVTDAGLNTATSSFVLTVTGTPQETWRFAYFGTTANSGSAGDSANPDGDSWTNAQEYLLGGNPQAADGAALLATSISGTNVVLTFTARQASGQNYTGLIRYYDLESATSLSNSPSWDPVGSNTNIVGDNQTKTVTLPLSAGPRFYRLKVRLQ